MASQISYTGIDGDFPVAGQVDHSDTSPNTLISGFASENCSIAAVLAGCQLGHALISSSPGVSRRF